MLADWVKNGETDKKITQNPLFERNGAMVDMSRNAVMNVESVKCLFRKMALMGFNTFMLYTEDTYEIDGYPKSEKDYKLAISEIVSEEIFKMIT